MKEKEKKKEKKKKRSDNLMWYNIFNVVWSWKNSKFQNDIEESSSDVINRQN